MFTPSAVSSCASVASNPCIDNTAMYSIQLPPGMQLLPRADDNLDIALQAGIDRRGIILYTLANPNGFTTGVPLSDARMVSGNEIVGGSELFSDGSVQKHTLCINIASYGSFTEQKYAYRTRGLNRIGKTCAEVAKQAAEVAKKFFETRIESLASDHNKLGLGGLGRRFEDLYLVGLVPVVKHKRMYECIFGLYTTTEDTGLLDSWSSRYMNIFQTTSVSIKQLPEYTDQLYQQVALDENKVKHNKCSPAYPQVPIRPRQGRKYEPISASARKRLSSHSSARATAPQSMTAVHTESSSSKYAPAYCPPMHPPHSTWVTSDFTSNTIQSSYNLPSPHLPDEWFSDPQEFPEKVPKSESPAEEYPYAAFHPVIPRRHITNYGHIQNDMEVHGQVYSYYDHPIPSNLPLPSCQSTLGSTYISAVPSALNSAERNDDAACYSSYHDQSDFEIQSGITHSSAAPYNGEQYEHTAMGAAQIDGDAKMILQLYLDNQRSASSSSPASDYSTPRPTVRDSNRWHP